ncbi:RT0821/Lpp0805 family surface protein [Caballeronia sp. LP006]|jgi:surface antigen|uniref:RT0821/Lpp0805 family surface protein n=1 Tax=unclassified Caballeronia TaxID=2646786 RepID=UPI001FD2EE42|nr:MULTISPECIES: RT0821/Lpp0805 family surface protein [unclassified Caballeronia]MDR5772047.1 RT0821/Lpp0805 family surface protein [Caballeronia sp. LZ002]MDR5804474.1 RT0821/Lpp0805 family surface protein [Caballeronia sp. LZ001]MDR5831689.1 RT0821/Lpp0805 family surface protein [Caballeronia sp. LP006]MDR5847481.1 RT0821/Lpp0805 family surface protein [Caballeronia sp. LZ003]
MPIEYRPLARACIRTLTATVLVAASASAFAANLGFLNNTPITYMKQRDLQALNRAAQTALETKKDGESLDWDNKDAGNTVPVHGTITPRETFEDAGLKCRKVEIVAIAKGQTQTWTPSACKQASGKWQLKKQ